MAKSLIAALTLVLLPAVAAAATGGAGYEQPAWQLLASKIAATCGRGMPAPPCCLSLAAGVEIGGGVASLGLLAAQPPLVLVEMNSSRLRVLLTTCRALHAAGGIRRGLDMLPSCNVSLFAEEIIERCVHDRPTAPCCEPVMAAFAAGSNANCICLMMITNQMQSSSITVEDVIRMYRLCGGHASISSDVCDTDNAASPSASALLTSQPVPSPPPIISQQPPAAPTTMPSVSQEAHINHNAANGTSAIWLLLLAIPVCALTVVCGYCCCHNSNSRRRDRELPEVASVAPAPAPAMLPPPSPSSRHPLSEAPLLHLQHSCSSPAAVPPPLPPSLTTPSPAPPPEVELPVMAASEDEEGAALSARRRGTRIRKPVVRLDL